MGRLGSYCLFIEMPWGFKEGRESKECVSVQERVCVYVWVCVEVVAWWHGDGMHALWTSLPKNFCLEIKLVNIIVMLP